MQQFFPKFSSVRPFTNHKGGDCSKIVYPECFSSRGFYTVPDRHTHKQSFRTQMLPLPLPLPLKPDPPGWWRLGKNFKG